MYPITLSKGSVTVCIDGNAHTLMNSHPNYHLVMSAIADKRWDELPSLVNPAKAIEAASGGSFRVEDGDVVVKTDAGEFICPSLLSETILTFMEECLDFTPLVNFAKKLSENPSEYAIEQLFGWMKTAKMTITSDGNFIAYKGVRSDMTDCRTGTFDNSVGKPVSMPREEVDADPNRSCSRGLHVANYDYAHNYYGGGGNVTILVSVHPKDVVAVPIGEHQKMRVCEYKVLAISDGELDEYIYNSDNAINAELANSFDPEDMV